jgi:large-conductance mechanosensitive channel
VSIILAFVIFVMIKQTNRLIKEVSAVVPPPTEEIVRLRQIREGLKVPG